MQDDCDSHHLFIYYVNRTKVHEKMKKNAEKTHTHKTQETEREKNKKTNKPKKTHKKPPHKKHLTKSTSQKTSQMVHMQFTMWKCQETNR